MSETQAWALSLTRQNRLVLLDLLLDVQSELQLNPGSPSIPLMPKGVKFWELCPANTIGARDNYMELRYKAADSLARRGILYEVETLEGLHRWETLLTFSGDLAVVNPLVDALRNSLGRERRKKNRFIPYASHVISFAAGLSLASAAIVRDVWWLWVIAVGLLVTLTATLNVIPRFRLTFDRAVGWATIIGALAGLVSLVWSIMQTTSGIH